MPYDVYWAIESRRSYSTLQTDRRISLGYDGKLLSQNNYVHRSYSIIESQVNFDCCFILCSINFP